MVTTTSAIRMQQPSKGRVTPKSNDRTVIQPRGRRPSNFHKQVPPWELSFRETWDPQKWNNLFPGYAGISILIFVMSHKSRDKWRNRKVTIVAGQVTRHSSCTVCKDSLILLKAWKANRKPSIFCLTRYRRYDHWFKFPHSLHRTWTLINNTFLTPEGRFPTVPSRLKGKSPTTGWHAPSHTKE